MFYVIKLILFYLARRQIDFVFLSEWFGILNIRDVHALMYGLMYNTSFVASSKRAEGHSGA
jgi:hypothetical protein